MNPQTAILYISNMLHGRFFNPSGYLSANSDLFIGIISSFRYASIALFLLFLVLEINRRLLGGFSDRWVDWMPLVIGGSLLAVIIGSPTAYVQVCKLTISLADQVGRAIDNAEAQTIGMEIQNLMKGSLLDSLNPVALFTAILSLFNPLTWLTVALYWVATGLLFILPILQGALLGLFVLLGPILLPMAIFKPFSQIALTWCFSLVAVTFISAFGLIAYTALAISGILTFISESQSNVFLSATYSLVTILVILSVPRVAFRLFRGTYASTSKGIHSIAKLF
jgi:hypothetical protein